MTIGSQNIDIVIELDHIRVNHRLAIQTFSQVVIAIHLIGERSQVWSLLWYFGGIATIAQMSMDR